MKVKFIVLFLLLQYSINGQMVAPDVIPPSPISWEFQKFSNYPISHATGLVDISIPIYNIQANGLNIPVGLKYHPGGIKVNQDRGVLGYGWSLFPGLRISRTVLGKSDENSNFYFKPSVGVYGNNYDDLIYLYKNVTGEGYEDYDSQHDVFYISLPNQSGSFIIDKQDGVFSASHIEGSLLKIENIKYTRPSSGGSNFIYSIEVVDENGNRYYFGQENAEYRNTEGYLEMNVYVVTGWMLRKIELQGTTETITFDYQKVPNHTISCTNSYLHVSDPYNQDTKCAPNIEGDHSFDFKYYMDRTLCGRWIFPRADLSSEIGPCNYDDYNYTFDYSTVRQMGCYDKSSSIKTITFPSGELRVGYSCGIYGEPCNISSIEVLCTKDGINPIKEVNLSIDGDLLSGLSINNEENYHFDYYDAGDFDLNAQDLWGYYNGKTGNTSLIPKVKLFLNSKYTVIEETLGDVDRPVNEFKMKKNMLKTIAYPTGGTKTFYYEANQNEDLEKGAGLRVKQIDTYDPVKGQTYTRSFKYGKNEDGAGVASYWLTPDDFVKTSIQKFCRTRIINSSPVVTFFANPVLYDVVTEYNETGKIVYDYAGYIGLAKDLYANHNFYQVNSLAYKIKEPFFIRYYEKDGINPLREIINSYVFFPTGSVQGYTINDISGVDPLKYSDIEYWVWNELWHLGGNCEIILDHNQPLFEVQEYVIPTGANLLYSRESIDYFENGKQVNKKTMYDYSYMDDKYYLQLKSTTTTDSRGLENKTKFYYPYDPLSATYLGSIADTMVERNIIAPVIQKSKTVDQVSTQETTTLYKLWGSNNYVKPKEQTVLYFEEIAKASFELEEETGGDFEWGTGNYYTDVISGDRSYEPVGRSTIMTTGLLPPGQYKLSLYLKNTNGNTGGALAPSFGGKLIRPSSEWEYVERVFTISSSAQKVTLYSACGGSNCNIMVDDIRIHTIGHPITNYFDDYDEHGNLLQHHAEDDVEISYLWGYNNTYPIAKVVNAKVNEIAYTSFEDASSLGGWNFIYDADQCHNSCSSIAESTARSTCTDQCNSSCPDACNGNPDCIESCFKDCFSSCYSGRYDQIYQACYTGCSATSAHPINNDSKTGKVSFYPTTINKVGIPANDYKLSFWIKKHDANNGSVQINGANHSITNNNWNYKEFVLKNCTDVRLSFNRVRIDELRLCPVDAQMETYTYDPLVGMTSHTDANNVTTYYEYDSFGRLQRALDDDRNVLKEHKYNYAQ